MLRQIIKPEREEGNIDITPMLDVVFIMLIFFIVTATFIKESGTKVDKPRAFTGSVQDKASILIAIDADDQVWVDRQSIDVRGLRAIIERLHAENPRGSIVIQADKQSRNEVLVDVLDAATRAGVKNVAISTLER
jgi:biopolymer transport protein ExbD